MNRRLRILHLEDNVRDAELVQHELEQAGLAADVTLAKSHDDFLAALEAGEFDVILSDNSIPGCDGVRAAEMAREKWPTTPFIFVSGSGDERERRENLLETGAAEYLNKSDLGKLHHAILDALGHLRTEPPQPPPPPPASRPSDWYLRAMERLVVVVQELSLARGLDQIAAIVRHAARELTGADGATFVLREGDLCHYADEEAVAPLWKGKRFPVNFCISGWVMLNRQAAVIEDIFADPRIPADAYQPTFVKSLVMVPIRTADPVGAIGNYWATRRQPLPEEVELLQALADSTSVAMENVQLYAGLERQVADRTVRLRMLNQELEAFSHSVSHDLRAPLRHIDAFLEKLHQDTGNTLTPASRRHLAVITESARKMDLLIEDLLGFSRAGQAELHRGDVDMQQLVAEVWRELGPETAARDIEWYVGDLPTTNGDRAMLKQVWTNLLSNAVKYTRHRAPARIRVRATVRDGEIEFAVQDNGAGFEMALAQKLFGVFERLHPAEQFEGTGVGLATVRRIISRHGGRTWAEGAVDRGATFYFTLPAGEAGR